MNGTTLQNKIPKFVDTDNLPKQYYEEVNPYVKRPECIINIKKLSQFVKENKCNVEDITKEEAKIFMN